MPSWRQAVLRAARQAVWQSGVAGSVAGDVAIGVMGGVTGGVAAKSIAGLLGATTLLCTLCAAG